MINPNIGDPLIYAISGWSNNIKSIPIPIPPYPRSKPPHAPPNPHLSPHMPPPTMFTSSFGHFEDLLFPVLQEARLRDLVRHHRLGRLAHLGEGAEVIGKTTGKEWNIRKYQNCVCEFMGKSWKINRVSRLEWNGERWWTWYLKLVWYWFDGCFACFKGKSGNHFGTLQVLVPNNKPSQQSLVCSSIWSPNKVDKN